MGNGANSGSGSLERIEKELGALKEATVEHRVRLENGSKVFATVSERIGKVEQLVAPKPVSIYKVVGVTLSLVIAGAGALWGLAQTIRDRPTIEQIGQMFDQHDAQHEAAGHQDMKADIQHIQVTQGALIKDVGAVAKSQEKVEEKVDTLLERIPAKRNR